MLGKPLLFLSAYAPLFALLAIRFDPLILIITCVALAGTGVGALIFLFYLDGRAEPGVHTLAKVKDAGAEAGAFLGTYLLPFLTVSSPSIWDSIAYILFLAMTAAVYLRSSVVQINPLLYALGYRVVEVVDTKGLRAYLVTRKRPEAGQTVTATRLSGDVLVERRAKRKL